MKKLNQSYNLYPVYETVEVMHLVVKSGILTIDKDKQDRVIIKGDSRAINLIDIIYNHNPNSTPTKGHIGLFDDREFIFPKGYAYEVSSADNDGIMVALHIYKKELIDFNGQMINEDPESPWYPTYTEGLVDDHMILV